MSEAVFLELVVYPYAQAGFITAMIRVVLMVVQVESKAHANVVVYPYIGFLEFLALVIAEIRLET